MHFMFFGSKIIRKCVLTRAKHIWHRQLRVTLPLGICLQFFNLLSHTHLHTNTLKGLTGPRGRTGRPGNNGNNGDNGVCLYGYVLANGTISKELLVPPSIAGMSLDAILDFIYTEKCKSFLNTTQFLCS